MLMKLFPSCMLDVYQAMCLERLTVAEKEAFVAPMLAMLAVGLNYAHSKVRRRPACPPPAPCMLPPLRAAPAVRRGSLPDANRALCRPPPG
jgi:hypothetical protein